MNTPRAVGDLIRFSQTEPPQPTRLPEPTGPAERPLTPGEALMMLFLDNADNGRNAANDELVAALRKRLREIQAKR